MLQNHLTIAVTKKVMVIRDHEASMPYPGTWGSVRATRNQYRTISSWRKKLSITRRKRIKLHSIPASGRKTRDDVKYHGCHIGQLVVCLYLPLERRWFVLGTVMAREPLGTSFSGVRRCNQDYKQRSVVRLCSICQSQSHDNTVVEFTGPRQTPLI